VALLCTYQYEYEAGEVWNEKTCTLAAGILDCTDVLSFLHEHGCPWDASCCEKAAKSGCLASLQYAHEHGCPWDSSTCTAAAARNKISCLTYAHEHGCPWDASAYEHTLYGGACERYLKE
jgi:hypothetical protein